MSRKDVVGAVIVRGDRILLAQRACDSLNGKWEFPGGKVEPGESHQQALVREILEELGVEVTVAGKVASNDFSIGEKLYTLHCYWAGIASGEPIADEHHSLMWADPKGLLNYDLAPADVPIAQEILGNDW